MITLIKDLDNNSIENIGTALKNGDTAVIPTDTIYGVVTSALNKESVEKVYRIRKRSPEKPFIILINQLSDLNTFRISLSKNELNVLNNIWPNKVSAVLPCNNEELFYLHRGTNALAFRLPQDEFLNRLLKFSGPLIAPSANLEGESPAETISKALEYFSNKVDIYIDGGVIKGQSSTLISLIDEKVTLLRQGDVKVSLISD